MKILDCSDFKQNPNTIKSIFSHFLMTELTSIRKQNSLGLIQILRKYSFRDINDALRNIKINDDGDLEIQDNTRYCTILKFLEYGGEGVRALNLLSKAESKFRTTFSKEE